MKKNTIKATIYALGGFVVSFVSFLGIMCMYFSGTFLPVYVNGTYVIENQIMRYVMYFILFVVGILAAMLAGYGINYLTKKFHKKRRRR